MTLLRRAMLILFHVLVICVPFVFTWVNEELFEFPKMLVTYVLTVGIVGLWGTRMIVEQRVIFRRTPFDIPIVLFLVSQLASTIFSIHPYTSFFGYYTRFHGGLLSTITYIALFYAFVSTVEKKQIRGLLISLLVAAIGVSAYAIPEHFGHSPSCYLITGGQQFDVTCWVQDVQNRVFGTFGQPNWLAAYAITLLPLALSMAVTKLWPSDRKLLLPSSYLQIAKSGFFVLIVAMLYTVLLFTQSKSGILGLVIGLISWAGLAKWIAFRHPDHPTLPTRVQFKTLAIVGVIVISLFAGLAQSIGEPFAPNFTQFASRYLPDLKTPTEAETLPAEATTAPVVNRLDIGGTDSGEIRKIVWTGAWQVFQRYPLLGSGVETFAYSYYQDRPVEHNLVSEWDFLYNKAHNEFLNYLATTGVVGFATYTLLLIWFGVWVVRAISTQKNELSLADKYLLVGFLAGLISLSVSNALGFSTVMVTIIMYLFFAMSVVLSSKEITGASKPAPLTSLHHFSLAGVGISVLYIWWMIFSWWSADHVFTKGKQYLQSGYTWEGLAFLESATQQAPGEALFFDELANTYAMIAASLAQQEDATTAAQVADAAIATSNQALALNSRHLNFHKSRARVFINLSTLDPKYFTQAAAALKTAIELSPTDAKLLFNLALVELALEQPAEAKQTLLKTIEMKPNYDAARLELARLYQNEGELDLAREQYQYIISNEKTPNPVVHQELDQLNRAATASTQTR